MEDKEKTIYELELHECLKIAEEIFVTRVPGGWIYEFQKPQVNILELVFVPFNNEFEQKVKGQGSTTEDDIIIN